MESTATLAEEAHTEQTPALKLDDESINEPLQSTTALSPKVGSGADGQPGALGKRLGETMEQTQALYEAKLSAWRPRIQKVTDPVAFMTSGETTDGKTSSVGNYDRAVQDRSSAGGFYELAKAECAALATEIAAASQGSDIEPIHMVSLQRLSVFVAAYGALYAAIQDTGMSTGAAADPAKRAALAQQVDAKVLATRASMAEVPPDVMGGIGAAVASALDEISLFVSSWSTISAASGQTDASPYMWANFLQTVERYRAILNEYGELEARGGDATGTAKLAIRKADGEYAHTAEEADQAAQTEGGYMAFALRSYGMHPEQAQKYIEQLKDVVARLKAGEFATQEACVAAFRAQIGGGRASELFYKNLDKLAQGQWKAYLAGIEADLEKQAYTLAGQYQDEATGHLSDVDKTTALRDASAVSFEKNDFHLGMSEDDLIARGKEALNDERDIVNPKYDPRGALQDLLGGAPDDEQQPITAANYADYMKTVDPDGDGFYETHTFDEWGNLHISYYGPDTAMVVGGPSGPSDAQLVELGKSTMADQQLEVIGMDQEGADAALENALALQQKAQEHMKAARANVDAAGEQLEIGLGHSLMARKYVAEARMHAASVKGSHPALLKGLSMLDTELAAVELKLSDNAEYRAIIVAYQGQLEGIIADRTADLEAYNPQRLEVPLPTATVDGVQLTSKLYSKVSIDMSGPAWWPFYWMGGVSGEYSETTSTDPAKDGWSTARIEAYVGLAAKMWLLEAGVKLSGYFEARKKNADDLVDTVNSGAEELGRWAYAWWYNLGNITKDADTAMLTAKSRMGMLYDKLDQDAADAAAFEKTRGTSLGLVDIIQKDLALDLMSAFSGKEGEMLSLVDALEMTVAVLPSEDIKEGLQALEGADEQEARAQIAVERTSFESTTDKARKEAVGEVSLVDPGRNDPNVKFEAGVGIEGYLSASAGSAAKVKIGASRVWYISDGDGDDFDFDVKEKDILKLQVTIGKKGGGVTVTGKPSSKGWEFGIEATIPTDHTSNVDGSETLIKVREAIQKVEAADLEAWGSGLLKIFKDDDAITKQFETKTSSAVLVKVGGSVKLDKHWDLTGGTVTFGIASKVIAGNAFVKASFETGNKVTLSF